jgi:hypothetical protein
VRIGTGWLALASLAVASGCSSDDFPTVATTGRVVCEGKPVPYVMVFFEPMQTGKSALVGSQGRAIADSEGKFSISTYGTNDGAVVGHHRIRVGPPHSEDHPGFKCACLVSAERDVMEVDIKKGQKNDFEVVLKKRTAGDSVLKTDD